MLELSAYVTWVLVLLDALIVDPLPLLRGEVNGLQYWNAPITWDPLIVYVHHTPSWGEANFLRMLKGAGCTEPPPFSEFQFPEFQPDSAGLHSSPRQRPNGAGAATSMVGTLRAGNQTLGGSFSTGPQDMSSAPPGRRCEHWRRSS